MPKIQQKKSIKIKKDTKKDFLSVLFGSETDKKRLSAKDEEKITQFEKGLANSIYKTDTIENAIEKIVKTALACEFGTGMVTQKGSEKMIKTISYGIISDSELRKQALIIIDKFAKAPKHLPITPLGKYN